MHYFRVFDGPLRTFKLFDKMWLNLCVGSSTIPTAFHQRLWVKLHFETRFSDEIVTHDTLWLKLQIP